MVVKKKAFIILNILVPIILGAAIYYFISPDVNFVKKLDSFFGTSRHITSIDTSIGLARYVRYYLPDILWGYALIFALYGILSNDNIELSKIIIIALAFSVFIEILQLTSIASGTFDFYDIVVEFFAEAIAIVIIKKYLTGGKKIEKRC